MCTLKVIHDVILFSQRSLSTCWSPGVPDTDCPGHGLCCSDGCANHCLGNRAPPPARTTPRYEKESTCI